METERTILRYITQEDFEEILEMYGEPDTFKYIAPALNKTREWYINFLQTRIDQVTNGSGYHWVARSKENNEFMGLMNLNPIAGTDKVQVGFQLRREYWNQGYASELTKRVLEFGFDDTGLRVIYGVFDKENTASLKIFQKFGFEFEESKSFEGESSPVEIWKYIAEQK